MPDTTGLTADRSRTRATRGPKDLEDTPPPYFGRSAGEGFIAKVCRESNRSDGPPDPASGRSTGTSDRCDVRGI